MGSVQLPRPSLERPAAEELEINVFGPGVGECVLIHLGRSEWLMVDSCVGFGNSEPAAVRYLRSLGLDSTHISLIVASHWHDDHIRGISQVYREATRSRFFVSAAVSVDELLALTGSLPPPPSRFSSGIREMSDVARIASERGLPVGTAVSAKRILSQDRGAVREIWSLSPSDRDISICQSRLAAAMQSYAPGQRRIPAQSSNDASVVLQLQTVAGPIVLGGDLEHRQGDKLRGWSAIVSLDGSPGGLATCFKIPHHGSINAFCPEYWEAHVDPDVVSVVTPFDRGRQSLPMETDRERIRARSGEAYLTSEKRGRSARLNRSVARTVAESTLEFSPRTMLMGHVQLRWTNGAWIVAGSEESTPL